MRAARAASLLLLFGCSEVAVIAVVPDRTLDASARDAESDTGVRVEDAGMPPVAGDARRCGRELEIEICNPITNTGCAVDLRMQCDVDLTATTLRGQCVFRAPAPDGGTCLNIPPTESCPPRHTCVAFDQCRKLCLCDTDCDPGDCCNESLLETGFRLCGAC